MDTKMILFTWTTSQEVPWFSVAVLTKCNSSIKHKEKLFEEALILYDPNSLQAA